MAELKKANNPERLKEIRDTEPQFIERQKEERESGLPNEMRVPRSTAEEYAKAFDQGEGLVWLWHAYATARAYGEEVPESVLAYFDRVVRVLLDGVVEDREGNFQKMYGDIRSFSAEALELNQIGAGNPISRHNDRRWETMAIAFVECRYRLYRKHGTPNIEGLAAETVAEVFKVTPRTIRNAYKRYVERYGDPELSWPPEERFPRLEK